MNSPFKVLESVKRPPISILDSEIRLKKYCSINLSDSNSDLASMVITDPMVCQKYIDSVLRMNNAVVAYGGYLEKRSIYNNKPGFINVNNVRNIHLGIDFWSKAGTKVLAPISGMVHSFKNNKIAGDYGPTIILKHCVKGFEFYTLYGHLSLESIANIKIGQEFKAGSTLATLGTSEINVNYAPHLHFQIVIDLEGNIGDYPGVCSEENLEFYKNNCPDPNLILNM